MITLYSFVANVMLWGSIVLAGGLEYWERELSLSTLNHTFLQVGILLVIYGWVWFWNGKVEKYQLATLLKDTNRKIPPITYSGNSFSDNKNIIRISNTYSSTRNN
jgi:hypothetical protein